MTRIKSVLRDKWPSVFLQRTSWLKQHTHDEHKELPFLLRLPGELRNLIYHFTLLDEHSQRHMNAIMTRTEYNEIKRDREIARRTQAYQDYYIDLSSIPKELPTQKTDRRRLGLVFVNKQIHAETLSLLHERVTFSTSFGLDPFGLDSDDMRSCSTHATFKRLRVIDELADAEPELMQPYHNARKVHLLIYLFPPIGNQMTRWSSSQKWSILRQMVQLRELTLEFFTDEESLGPLKDRLLEPILANVRRDSKVNIVAMFDRT